MYNKLKLSKQIFTHRQAEPSRQVTESNKLLHLIFEFLNISLATSADSFQEQEQYIFYHSLYLASHRD